MTIYSASYVATIRVDIDIAAVGISDAEAIARSIRLELPTPMIGELPAHLRDGRAVSIQPEACGWILNAVERAPEHIQRIASDRT